MSSVRQFIVLILASVSLGLSAQLDSAWSTKPEIELSGFVDVFYVYDFNQPLSNKRQAFLYNHNRHNEFNLNLGLFKIGVNHSKYRANLALQIGTYAIDNYAAEPGLLKNISEATVGLSLNRKNNLWIDAGIMPSHLGFENAISIENLTLTRSICAENSPYFLSGAKLTYTPSKKFEVAALITNGWQRIQRLTGNSLPAFGTQITYQPSKKVNLNWSTFIGSESPDSTRKMRYFSNLYGQLDISKRIKLIAGFDFGVQQRVKSSSNYHYWYSPVLISQFSISNRWKTSIRFEYYNDPSNVIIPTSTVNNFNVFGASLNFDYATNSYVAVRVEGRWLHSDINIFQQKHTNTNNNFIIATSVVLKFAELLTKKNALNY